MDKTTTRKISIKFYSWNGQILVTIKFVTKYLA